MTSNEATADQYSSGLYKSMHPTWHSQHASWKAEMVSVLLREAAIKPTSIVDIGCGTGGVLKVLADTLGLVSAVGYEPAVESAGGSGTGVEVRSDDFRACIDRFDLALLIDVLEHVGNPIEFLSDAAKLAPRVVVHLPLDANALALLSNGFMAQRRRVGHLSYFTVETALATVSDAGLHVDRFMLTESGRLPADFPLSKALRAIRFLTRPLSQRMRAKLVGGMSILILASS